MLSDFTIYPLLAVIGVDDAIVLGIGLAGVLFWARQKRIQSEFLDEHLDKIEEENERIADAWRASKPQENKLIVDRVFTPPVLLAPQVRVKQKFNRDSRPWYERWFPRT